MPTKTLWKSAPKHPAIKADEVHVWRAKLDRNADYVRRVSQILSEDERSRAERFHFERDRMHYTVSRGLLRTILSGYLQTPPDQLQFSYNKYGKPGLNLPVYHEILDFNLSHSFNMVLIAVARDRRVGIDIEHIRTDFSAGEIARNNLSPQENDMLHAIPSGKDKDSAFFRIWTCKEAYIKARGEGLSLPLDQVEVNFDSDDPATLVQTDSLEKSSWSLREIYPSKGFMAALAVEGMDWHLSCFDVPKFW